MFEYCSIINTLQKHSVQPSRSLSAKANSNKKRKQPVSQPSSKLKTKYRAGVFDEYIYKERVSKYSRLNRFSTFSFHCRNIPSFQKYI
ncbi:unnamed protein product [Rotaria sordida]|uniref:Uncharacterized protein n=1 Tax=Rotaria sordida TaxID=392033 RepID=A0A815YJR8_9BILA|nr:unnamed protein product [Rotaria sordida]CAF1572657.1 unnamed protein product [Rotaria sordida]